MSIEAFINGKKVDIKIGTMARLLWYYDIIEEIMNPSLKEKKYNIRTKRKILN